jgi:hypothetical protein
MNKDLLELIKHLSLQDKKTLSQKALKTAEESGELAKVVLPFDNAPGTLHRFVDKQSILEEAVDTCLSALSVAYDLGFNDTDIEDMMLYKSKKWATLQKGESLDTNKIPFEIHITVKDVDKEHFRAVCKAWDIKPIILDLQNNDGKTVFEDVMTSSVFIGSNVGAYNEMERIAQLLHDEDCQVVRKKIETVPWHPAAPSEKNDMDMPDDCYFECHIGILIERENDLGWVSYVAKRWDAHFSRNAFKKYDDGSYTIMLTHRVSYYMTAEKFQEDVARIKGELENHDLKVDKTIVEFSIYDTKVSHDNSWITSNETKS